MAVGYDISIVRQSVWRGSSAFYLYPKDLSKPCALGKFDMVLCWETAEHLPESAADTLCRTLWDAAAPGGHLLFTAAIPGQGGAGHVNEQPRGYWRSKLAGLGFVEELSLTAALRQVWSEVAPDAWWYGRNLIAFKREEGNA
jgi:hypothetical protein